MYFRNLDPKMQSLHALGLAIDKLVEQYFVKSSSIVVGGRTWSYVRTWGYGYHIVLHGSDLNSLGNDG
jgi:hypothetical protein